jgi:hypothetical protein
MINMKLRRIQEHGMNKPREVKIPKKKGEDYADKEKNRG